MYMSDTTAPSKFVIQAKMFILRVSPRLVVIYAAICLSWVGFAGLIAPQIISAAYEERNLSILNWVFHGRSLPVEHYIERWNVVAVAALLAAVLHLAIVLFICGANHKQRIQFLDGTQLSRANAALIIFSATFLAVTVLSGARGDYRGYLYQWTAALGGANPWDQDWVLMPLGASAYGPLFSMLAALAWVNPLANKLLFAFSYLVYTIWLIKDFAPRRGVVALSWSWLGLWLLSPFPWEQIAYFGHFDVLVSLACVAAVHSLVRNKDGASGAYLAVGILLKYMPVVILPFLVFSERRFHFRVLSFCVGVVILGFVVSVLIWGTSTFVPLKLIVTRHSDWSIYDILASPDSPLPFLESLNVDWVEKSLLFTAGLGIFTWCIFRQIEPVLSSALAILITLLFYWIGYTNYQMVLFSLISYWMVCNWTQFKGRSILVGLFVGYFGFLTIANLAFWYDWVQSIFHSEAIESLQFLLGCALLFGLVQLRPKPCSATLAGAPGKTNGKPAT